MSYLTKYGVYWGQVPNTVGRIFWVAPAASYTVEGRTYPASDNNDGLSPERALRTLSQAITNATASVGDVIVLLDGTHTVTATVRVTKAGLTITGLSTPGGRPRRRWAKPPAALASTGTNIPLLSIEADDTEVSHLTLIPTTGYSAIYFRNASPDDIFLHDLYFDLCTPAISTNTVGIDFGYRADNSTAGGGSIAKALKTSVQATAYVEFCSFVADGAQGAAIEIATASVTVKDCWFHNTAGTWASPFRVATLADNCSVEDTVWTTSGTMAACIEGGLADVTDAINIINCRFPATLGTSNRPIRGFGSGEATVAESYNQGNATAVTTVAS